MNEREHIVLDLGDNNKGNVDKKQLKETVDTMKQNENRNK